MGELLLNLDPTSDPAFTSCLCEDKPESLSGQVENGKSSCRSSQEHSAAEIDSSVKCHLNLETALSVFDGQLEPCEHLVTHDLSYDSTNDNFPADKMSSAEDFPIRDESALSSGSQLEEPTSQDSSDASEEYSCLGTATGQLTAVQEFSCQTVVTTSDLAPDGKRIEEESMINLHSDSLNTETCPAQSSNAEEDIEDAIDIPSSSPPTSSPVTSVYFRSSSPIPASSPPRGSSLTPPTSPARYPDDFAISSDAQESYGVDTIKTCHLSPALDSMDTRREIIEKEHQSPAVTDDTANTAEVNCLGSHSFVSNSFPAEDPTPRPKAQQNLIPGPKRATLAAQIIQHRKLSKPFRLPVIIQRPSVPPDAKAAEMTAPILNNTTSAIDTRKATSLVSVRQAEKSKDRTARAAAQFKPPLVVLSSGEASPLARPTPTIQALERKVQLLTRAVKVRENSEEKILTGLIEKWTEAGREVAWEVWNVVKENTDQGTGRKRNYDDSWGWQHAEESKRPKDECSHWGWDATHDHEREHEDDVVGRMKDTEVEEVPRRTLGTMLMELGIAPETLGWNEAEEAFVDK